MVYQKLLPFFPLSTNLAIPFDFISSGGGRQKYRLQFGGRCQFGVRSHWGRSPNHLAPKLSIICGRKWLPPPNWRKPLNYSATKKNSRGGGRQIEGGLLIILPPKYPLTAADSGYRLPIGGGFKNILLRTKILVMPINCKAEATGC